MATAKPHAKGKVAPGDCSQRVGVEQLTARGVNVEQLVEKLIYGSTIAEAAGGRLMEAMRGAAELGALATQVRNAMIADLPRATEFGIAALEEKAALTSDCEALLAALPPMADILSSGTHL